MSGYRAHAYLVYGIKFKDESVFPWAKDGDESIGIWWRKINGYGLNDNYPPEPVDTVNYCDFDVPEYILILSSIKYKESKQGYPVTIQISDLTIPETARDELISFCKEYRIQCDEPQWWLVACYE